MPNGQTELDVTPPIGDRPSPGECTEPSDRPAPPTEALESGVASTHSGQTVAEAIGPLTTSAGGQTETVGAVSSTKFEYHAPRQLSRPVRFLGEYEILDEIARGGMGVVYRARQDKLNRVVALKLIRDSSLAGPADLRRFQADAEALAQLDHPHIVPIYEIGQVDDQPYFSMRLIAGGNLTDHISRLQQDPRAAAALLAKVSRAVHYAHQRTILHRDIKPSNILLDEDGEPYVTDFGLAKRMGPDIAGTAATVPGMVMGTPAFMPPEQARGDSKSVTTAADVYSLGATLYTTLLGQPPFAGDSAAEIMRRVLDKDPSLPRSINPKLDRDLETICLKCLEKEPARRYGSAEALAEDLERWLAGMPIVARPVPAWEKVVKWVKRQPALAALVSILPLALLGLIVGGIWFTLQLRQERDLANRGRYAADMNLARRALDDGLNFQVREQLKDYQTGPRALARLRSFEWYYLANLCDPATIRLRGHKKAVVCVAFHPDGNRVVSGGADGSVRIWDLRSRQSVHVLERGGGVVSCVAFSLDGRWLAAGEDRGGLRLWELETRQERALAAHKSRLGSVDFSPTDSHRLLSCDQERLIVQWDVRTGKPEFELRHNREEDGVARPADPAGSLEHLGQFAAYAPDGQSIVSLGHDQWVRIWDVATRIQRDKIQVDTNIIGFSISPASRKLALAEQAPGIEILDLRNPHDPRRAVPLVGQLVTAVAFGPDGRTLAMVGKGVGAGLLDVEKGRILDRFDDGWSPSPFALAFGNNGRMLALAVGDEVHVVHLARSPNGTTVAAGVGPIRRLAVSPDERLLALGREDGTIVVWDLHAARVLQTLSGHGLAVFGMSFVPRRTVARLVSVGADGFTKIWDPESGGQPLFHAAGGAGAVFAVAVRPDGRQIATAGEDGLIRTWDPDTGRADLPPLDHGASISALAYDPFGAYLASGGRDRTVRIWATTSGRPRLGPLSHPHQLTSLAYSPDGRLLAGGGGATARGGKIRIWDAWNGAITAEVDCPRGVDDLSFSSDSRRIATCGSDAIVQVWDATGGVETLSLDALGGRVSAVLFASADLRLYSAGRDGVVKLWDGSSAAPAHLND
jgi:WD40 repeat protein/tRNA A-37 threonylcarbamoyl transferase component Bud32